MAKEKVTQRLAEAPHPAQVVAEESPNRIRDHLNRTAQFNPVLSLKALAIQVTQEYEDRFLVELVQNAYDAQPPGSRDGEVHVLFVEESEESAVLYVANTGRPFTRADFSALTNIAQSSKSPGEGIGNKGIGFRSVLQVCEGPEVFSSDPADPDPHGFNGYCFGFADDHAVRALTPTDEAYDEVKAAFPRHLLPVPARPDDPRLRSLREKGMATVVRLPLIGVGAVSAARMQVLQLCEERPPIALFLDRLCRIGVEVVNVAGEKRTAILTRFVEPIELTADGLQFDWVRTAGEKFLTIRRTLSAAAVRDAVEASIALNQLDTSWRRWNSDVDVALALRCAPHEPGEEFQTYTYLPMRTGTPLPAHVHAPFHTKMARLVLNENSAFNAFLIDSLARLAADAILRLVDETNPAVDGLTRRLAVADLLCWDSSHVERLCSAIEDAGSSIDDAALVPARRGSLTAWAPLNAVRRWQASDNRVLTTQALTEVALLIDSDLGEVRIARLAVLADELGLASLDPSDDELATWVEAVAATLGTDLRKWNRFYEEVSHAFEGRRVHALRGRRILIDDSAELRRAGPWETSGTKPEPTMFFPPQNLARDDDADDDSALARLETVPKNLRRAFGFLHAEIPLRVRSGSTFSQTPARALLQQAGLVENFELSTILDHLRRLLQNSSSETTYRQALKWVFDQERSSRAEIAGLARYRLRVPTAAGTWIEADTAVFSPEWQTPRSDVLSRLIERARGSSDWVEMLAQRLVLGPDSWPFAIGNRDRFRDFLKRCGVQDGLHPAPLRSTTPVRMHGNRFHPLNIAIRYALPEAEEWISMVTSSGVGWVAEHPETDYTATSPLWVVPGQEALAHFDSSTRALFARAIIDSLLDWPAESFAYTFERKAPHHARKPDPRSWPSPARCLLERASWFPMADANRRDDIYFTRLADGWTFDEQLTDQAPPFARLAPAAHRRRISNDPELLRRLEALGLRVWNHPASAEARLVELAQLVESGDIETPEAARLKRATREAWSHLAAASISPINLKCPLVVTRGSNLSHAPRTTDHPETVYVVDQVDGFVARVLSATNLPVLVGEPADGARIATLLTDRSDLAVSRTSSVRAEVSLDGREVRPGPATGLQVLDQFDHWFGRLALAVLSVRQTALRSITDRVIREAETKLRRLRIVTGNEIGVLVDGQRVQSNARLEECVHLDDAEYPLIVLRSSELEIPSWKATIAIADDLAELLGHDQLAAELRSAAHALQADLGEWREPTSEELARALRESADSVEEVLRSLRSSTEHVKTLITPFVAVYSDLPTAMRFEESRVRDFDELSAATEKAVGAERASFLLSEASNSESIEELWRRTSSDLGTLNVALRALGRPLLHFLEAHALATRQYVDAHRAEILTDVRGRFHAVFTVGGDLRQYAAFRDLRLISPDPTWLEHCSEPTPEMLSSHVAAWLNGLGPVADFQVDLLEVDTVRQGNLGHVDQWLPSIESTIRAWANHTAAAIPNAWNETHGIRDSLNSTGCLDFELLDIKALLTWLSRLGHWPEGMPESLDRTQLGLTADDFSAAAARRDDVARDRRRLRTELTFGDRTYDVSTDELLLLVNEVEGAISDGLASTPPKPLTLASLPTSRSRQRDTEPNGLGSPIHQRKPSADQATAIGLLGEAIAYKWLQRNFPETNPDSWVSGNRQRRLGGPEGDDHLGYDFRVMHAGQVLFFEVKATTSDAFEFDIGESEVRAARAARKGTYKIIFIRSILDSASQELLLLSNPFEPSSAGQFRQINQGMRLRFRPAPDAS